MRFLKFLFYIHRCVVWTGDGRVFFFKPSTRTSVWEKPDDLKGRSDVDKMVSNPPEVVQALKSAEGQSPSKKAKSDGGKFLKHIINFKYY